MERIIAVVFFVLISVSAWSQNTLTVIVKNEDSKEPLSGASVSIPSLHKGAATDSLGRVTFHDLPGGSVLLEISYVGYSPIKKNIRLPLVSNLLQVMMEEENNEDNPEVVVTATRTDRSIKNTPTRVEVIAGGEMTENSSMRPGEIRMLLNETTGIITQPTSGVSNTANLRIQELDGRYTQILRDGFPLYSGLSEGLSLVQIAPLDLKQVEIIKGSSSTLYGGGAIAGLINLVSKTPTDKRELTFLANGTSTHGLDLSGFYSEKYGKVGLTLFTARNSSQPYDAGNGFSAIPKYTRYTVSPRLFYYGKNTSISGGVSYITEDRLGGTMDYLQHGSSGYFEKNNTDRVTTEFSANRKLNEHSGLTFKNSYNHFNRNLTIPAYEFEGLQQSSFSELSWNSNTVKTSWVAGVNLYTDHFDERLHASITPRDYSYNTIGAFVQNTFSPGSFISVESGLRSDYTSPFGAIVLPRVSLLFHLSDELSSRLGGGLGYKLPTIFTEESEERHFRNILPINVQQTQYERSAGANLDFTYRTSIDELKLTINPLLFYTRINHPLVMDTSTGGKIGFVNAGGYTDSKGLDLSIRMILGKLNFYTGYSYTIATFFGS
jgi:outer membrane receptor for ferrienterochelin and colicins